MFKHSDFHVRQEAIKTFGHLNRHSEPFPSKKWEIIDGIFIEWLQDTSKDTISQLMEMLKDPHGDVRQAAITVLEELVQNGLLFSFRRIDNDP
jgi:hypothetical protein